MAEHTGQDTLQMQKNMLKKTLKQETRSQANLKSLLLLNKIT